MTVTRRRNAEPVRLFSVLFVGDGDNMVDRDSAARVCHLHQLCMRHRYMLAKRVQTQLHLGHDTRIDLAPRRTLEIVCGLLVPFLWSLPLIGYLVGFWETSSSWRSTSCITTLTYLEGTPFPNRMRALALMHLKSRRANHPAVSEGLFCDWQ